MYQDLSGRGPSVTRLTVSGIALLVALGVAIYLLMLRYTGFFADSVPVTAVLTSTGDGLPAQADVKFRGVLVGTVKHVEIAAKGARQHVDIDLYPNRAKEIPSNVTARVIPNNLFGVTAVELTENGPAPLGLHSGAVIGEDKHGSTQLQTTLTTLRTVLDRIEPAKLSRVLGTLADALAPQYRTPGSTIERLDRWITTVDDIPGIGELLGNLGKSAEGLTQSAPELVSVLDESVTSARTVIERRQNLVAMLTTANGTVDDVNSLFARNPNAGKALVVGLDKMVGSFSADPDAIPDSVANLNVALHRWEPVFHWGPRRLMAWSMHVSMLTPFRQYTAQDCPHYGALYGPRCGGPSVPASAPPQQIPANWKAGLAPMPVAPPAPPPNELHGDAAIAAIVGRTPTPAERLILTPLLQGLGISVDDRKGK